MTAVYLAPYSSCCEPSSAGLKHVHSLYSNITPLYIRGLCICRLWYLGGVLEPLWTPRDNCTDNLYDFSVVLKKEWKPWGRDAGPSVMVQLYHVRNQLMLSPFLQKEKNLYVFPT